jgi:hypothetical protein
MIKSLSETGDELVYKRDLLLILKVSLEAWVLFIVSRMEVCWESSKAS